MHAGDVGGLGEAAVGAGDDALAPDEPGEADDPLGHEHEWEVWRDVELPADRVLLPGLISHATNVLEHPELVAQRIVRLAGLVGRERVIASTDCGFAQTPYITRVHPTLIWAKLEALVEGARLASERLWAS